MDESNRAALYDCMMHANRAQLQKLVGELVRQAPDELVSSLVCLSVRLGYLSKAQPSSPWQSSRLPRNALASVLECLSFGEKLATAECVCRRWRDASLDGDGWHRLVFPRYLDGGTWVDDDDEELARERLFRLSRSGRWQNTQYIDASECCAPLQPLDWLARLPVRKLSLSLRFDNWDDSPDMHVLEQLAPRLESLRVHSPHTDAWPLAQLFPFSKMTQLRELALPGCAGSDLLPLLSNSMPLLTDLDLSQCGNIAPDDLPTSLTALKIAHAPLRPVHLERLAQLRTLELGGTFTPSEAVTEWNDAELGQFLNLFCVSTGSLTTLLGVSLHAPCAANLSTLLRVFDLSSSTSLSDQDTRVVRVKKLRIHSLFASETSTFDDSMASAFVTSNLSTLTLHNCSALTDAGLLEIARFTCLETLKMFRVLNVTDVGIDHLQTCRSLTNLSLSNCSQIRGTTCALLVKIRRLEFIKQVVSRATILSLAQLPLLISLSIRVLPTQRDLTTDPLLLQEFAKLNRSYASLGII